MSCFAKTGTTTTAAAATVSTTSSRNISGNSLKRFFNALAVIHLRNDFLNVKLKIESNSFFQCNFCIVFQSFLPFHILVFNFRHSEDMSLVMKHHFKSRIAVTYHFVVVVLLHL